jgi:Amt family ammonium transporter
MGAFAIMGWTVVTSGALFLALKLTVGLRVSEEEELRGLDFFEHSVEAYPDFSPAAGRGVLGGMPVEQSMSAPAWQATHQPAPGSAGG